MFHLLLLAAALLQLLPPIAGGEASPAEPALPLGASGRYIIDANNRRVKLAAVNWYGAEEQDYVVAGLEYAALPDIARQIRIMGFNAVRLPWSNEMYEANPAINDDRLAANPSLKGKRALEVFDAVIAALASEGLFVILDNHISDAGWCCSDTDGNGLWYNGRFPESTWIADWQGWRSGTSINPR
jgi:endoglucanase